MKIEERKQDGYTQELRVSDVSPAYINSLRRTFMSKVPTMAVDYVEISENDSALYDEIIAHRVGLVVLNTDLEGYNMPEEGADESPATHVKLSLEVEGPKTVYASDFESKDPNITPVHEKTPIVELMENQSLKMVATARLNTGKEHAKHQTGAISYYYKPHITVDNDADELDDVIDEYPPQVVEDGEIKEEKIDEPNLIEACEDVSDVVKIEYDNPHRDFVFKIESWGQLDPEDIVEKGISLFNEELESFREQMKNT